MSEEDGDLSTLEPDPEGDAIAELFEPELQEEARLALRSLKQGVADVSDSRKAAEARLADLYCGCNITTRRKCNHH
ncbi:MAG: hypothetical protein P1P90_03785 [Patescibacteria group bacterium]|nr:hypothetical protein [Patescibacteria group bacterium]